jgi:hypothetical protein
VKALRWLNEHGMLIMHSTRLDVVGQRPPKVEIDMKAPWAG